MTTLAIIGSAGRGSDLQRMSWPLYKAMYREALRIVQTFPKPHDVRSGGAAWADHVAVSLFLAGHLDSLSLFLPAPLEHDADAFVPTEAGCTSNYYHSLFSQHAGASTIAGIKRAIAKGARVDVSEGFHARNLKVGQVQVVIAFTFGEGDQPKDGGTAHTWRNSSAQTKIHVPLGRLNVC